MGFNAARHPQVIKGYCTKNEVFTEFVKMWDKNMDGVITMCEFGSYFFVRIYISLTDPFPRTSVPPYKIMITLHKCLRIYSDYEMILYVGFKFSKS